MRTIDLNADVGEGADDLPLLGVVSSINIACGAHAGDQPTMERCVDAAKRLELAVGAHPGYADREHAGRAASDISGEEIERSLAEQIATLASIAARLGVSLRHVKPHGALYNRAAVDRPLAALIARAAMEAGMLRVVGPPDSALLHAAIAQGLATTPEGFADRRYRPDGRLVPRSMGDALIEDPGEAAAQAVLLASGDPVPTLDGPPIRLACRTLCVHGDTPDAHEIARAVRRALERADFEIAPPG